MDYTLHILSSVMVPDQAHFVIGVGAVLRALLHHKVKNLILVIAGQGVLYPSYERQSPL